MLKKLAAKNCFSGNYKGNRLFWWAYVQEHSAFSMTIMSEQAEISPVRQWIVRIALFIFLGLLIHESIFQKDQKITKQINVGSASSNLEATLFEKQTKFVVGILKLAKSVTNDNSLDKQINDSVSGSLTESLETSVTEFNILIRQLILANYLKLEEVQEKILSQLRSGDLVSDEKEMFGKIESTIKGDEGARPEQSELLTEGLGWFGKLLVGSNFKGAEHILEEAEREAKQAAITFLLLSGIFSVIASLSFLFSAIFIYRLLRHRISYSFSPETTGTHFALESFVLYLFAMWSAPHLTTWLSKSFSAISPLTVNIVFLSALALLVLWPVLNGISGNTVRKLAGIHKEPLGKILRHLASGPVIYITAMVSFLICFTIYSLTLTYLGIDMQSGAHPVIPIFSSSKNSSTQIAIFVLAVFVAPVVEELMFRGMFYSWLRTKFAFFASAIISAVVFAAVHPQGALGVFPLTMIGFVLAYVREVRGSIYASIATHACVNFGTLTLAYLLLRQ